MTPDFEKIGRYTVLTEQAGKLVQQRNGVLQRVAMVASNAIKPPMIAKNAVGRSCDFAAVRRLLDEAEALEAEINTALDEIDTLAPIVDKPPLHLE